MFLRVLETQTFTRLGGNRNIKANVRFIIATNKDLAAEIGNGQFRRDLYYRINGFHIHIPPLRERREDIPPLVAAFISELSAKHRKRVTGITSEALHYLKGAAWPGNIRQLKNVVARAVIITQTDELKVEDLSADIALAPPSAHLESGKCRTTQKLPSAVSEILARPLCDRVHLYLRWHPNFCVAAPSDAYTGYGCS